MSKKKTTKTEISPQCTEWEWLMSWGAKADNQKAFNILEQHWVHGQRLPLSAEKAAQFGGVEQYLIYCEGMANAVRELKALKFRYEKFQADRRDQNE